MALQRQALLWFCVAVFVSFNVTSCFGANFQEANSIHSLVDLDEESGYNSRAFPSCMSSIEGVKFKECIRPRADQLFSSRRLDTISNVKKSSSVNTLSVDNFGAKGNGADDTQAFAKAWKAACSANGAVVLVVPQKSYLVGPIQFSGPCKSQLTLQILGTIEASGDRSIYKDTAHWLIFDNVQNFVVVGPGTINGNGNIWWKNSCKKKAQPCGQSAPTAATFNRCNNLVVKNLKFKDAQQMHVRFENCVNVVASQLTVTAPEDSPNTDGIHVTNTQNITISNSVIGTGDDCISIVSGSRNVQATDITCGPGHGISIGSLGQDNSEDHVSSVTVNGAKISGTQNGVRIKTWQGGSGSASNINFLNVEMNNVNNPIIIDQNYCDQKTKDCKQQKSAVQVKNVLFQNIKGTSASANAVTLDCSQSMPCQGIVLQDIQLRNGKAECKNVQPTYKGAVSPRCS